MEAEGEAQKRPADAAPGTPPREKQVAGEAPELSEDEPARRGWKRGALRRRAAAAVRRDCSVGCHAGGGKHRGVDVQRSIRGKMGKLMGRLGERIVSMEGRTTTIERTITRRAKGAGPRDG